VEDQRAMKHHLNLRWPWYSARDHCRS